MTLKGGCPRSASRRVFMFINSNSNFYIIKILKSIKNIPEGQFLFLCNPMNCSLPDSSVHGIFQARILEWVAISYPGNLPNPRMEPTCLVSLQWQADSLPLRHLGEVLVSKLCLTLCNSIDYSLPISSVWNSPGKNSGVGSHSLLQGIFPIQRLNPGLLHCRQILYHSFTTLCSSVY